MEQIRTKHLKEKQDGIALFTTQFWKDRVLIGDVQLQLGQVSTDVLNLDLQKLQDLRLNNDTLFRTFAELIRENEKLSLDIVTKTQFLLNNSLDVLRELPIYKNLKIDWDGLYNLFLHEYNSNPEWLGTMLRTNNEYRSGTIGLIRSICKIPDEMITFSLYTQFMLTDYFERLERRSPEYYAVGVYDFFTNEWVQESVAKSIEHLSVEPYTQSRSVKFEHVTMPDPDDKKKYVIAERLVFLTASAFLHTDFYRGLIQGNAPRKCHNCGRYFLLTEGYNTCYCNNIAPGEIKKTCRKIGAHRKQGNTEGKPPIQLEYNKVYNRLKTRKSRGKISNDEWNGLVSNALEYKEKAESGQITEFELKRIFEKI